MVADDIGLTIFNDLDGYPPELQFSPDGKYIAVWSEHGNLAKDRVDDSLSFYRTADLTKFLDSSVESQPPVPAWVMTRSTKQRRAIQDWRWLSDSSAVAFLERSTTGHRIAVADVRKKAVEFLTGEIDQIQEFDKGFDISDRQHYMYVAPDPAELAKRKRGSEGPALVATGSINELLFPNDERYWVHRKVWAVIAGRPEQVKWNGKPIEENGEFALSPDGESIITKLAIQEVPGSWERLYPAPNDSDPDNRIHAGSKDVKEYVLFDLKTRSVEPLTGAPVSQDAGWWWGGFHASWSSDGKHVLLPGTFIRSKDDSPSRPCVAVIDLPAKTASCVEVLKTRTKPREEGYHYIMGADFVAGNSQRVLVRFLDKSGYYETEYERGTDDAWHSIGQFSAGRAEYGNLQTSVKRDLNHPPVLMASNGKTTRAIWDPNPQLKDIVLAQATVYTWQDEGRRPARGGLYKPIDYMPGHRYPLVVQTHGFGETEFIPSGVFPTAFAAQELASAGIIVLQAQDQAADCAPPITPEEGPCAASNYESAIKQLVSEGLVDPEKVGIIGFSRSCFTVMELLTARSIPIKAASITDGWMVTYFQYMQWPGRFSGEADKMIGAPPFGEGLQQWFKKSPGFNLDKVKTALLVNALGPESVLMMWEPYAGLQHLKKPVDMIMLKSDEHVITNPVERMLSQGVSVDWFRFWLQDHEDPDPAKAEQYKRWRELKKMQAENEKKLANESSRLSH